MQARQLKCGAGLVACAIAPFALAQGAGPDVAVGELPDVLRLGQAGGITAYSIGTYSCNVGTVPLQWNRFTPAHPVIAQNLYRIKGGRFEQIGLGWLKHGYFAETDSLCSTCVIPPGYNGQQLGVGCADLYTSSINANQNQAGPRSQVNALTGVFTYPVDYTGFPAAQATIGRRVQVQNGDVDPALNAGARYFIEGHYVTADDAGADNGANNASYREVVVSSPSTFAMSTTGSTVRELPAIYAWASDPLVTITSQTIAGVGTITVGSRVESLGGGLWRYTYAVHNLNCDRAVSALSMQVSTCAIFTQPWSSLPRYHSGEIWGNQPWVFGAGGGLVGWATSETFGQNPNTSAIRWSSVGSFEFVADRPPTWRSVSVSLFTPGSPTLVSIAGWIPGQNPDYDLDGTVDFFDYDVFVGDFESGDPRADFDGDGTVDFFDYDEFVRAFEAGC